MPLSDLQAALRDAIQKNAGHTGIDKFEKKMSVPNPPMIEKAGGEPDLGVLMGLLLDIFPEDTAEAIISQAGKRFNEVRRGAQAGASRHDIESILQDSIAKKAGSEGLKDFVKKVNGQRMTHVTMNDGSPDLYLLMNILLDVFPEDMASGIMDETLAMYESMLKKHESTPVVEQKTVRLPALEPTPTTRHKPSQEELKNKLAMYVNVDVSEVSDLINEARRIRTAMGKMDPKAAAQQAVPIKPEPEPEPIVKHEPAPKPVPVQAPSPPKPVKPLSSEELEREIHAFLEGQKAYTSIDIIDFIRYLKDKGYTFQENNVLEKVYLKIEERKSKTRASIVSEIGRFLEERPWPSEEDVSGFIEKLKTGGLIYDDAEVKRMIRIEMFRKS